MISDGVDAIMINPASDTALDAIIEEACKQKIVVVSFDQGVTAPCAYNVGVDYVKLGEIHAQWMADTLGGKGNVVINRGVSGFPADKNSIRALATCSTNTLTSRLPPKSTANGTMRSASRN